MTHTIDENEIAIPADIRERLMSGERIKFGGSTQQPIQHALPSTQPTQDEVFAMRRYAAQYRTEHPSATDAQVSKAVRKNFNVKLK